MFVVYKNGKKGVLGHGAKSASKLNTETQLRWNSLSAAMLATPISTMPTALLSSMLSLSCLPSDVSCSFHGSTVAYFVV